MRWNYRIGTFKDPRYPDEQLYKLIDCYYANGQLVSYGTPDLRLVENPEDFRHLIEKLQTLLDSAKPYVDLDNFPAEISQDKDWRFEHFLNKVLQMNLFETFQNFMAARGIFVSIVADGYKYSGDVSWRGLIAYKDPATGEWFEDDLGATDLHEMQFLTKKAAVQAALELKVSWS